ncbi:MAG: hypothetical protein ACYC5K_05050 [Saccharofermentanales bacterium]
MEKTDYKNIATNIDYYRSLAFWSWNGKMESNEIVRQIDGFAANGYGGFFIHSRAGLEIGYMGDDWFRACEIAVEHAVRKNLTVWIYDEDGWPSGFAGGVVPAMGDAYRFKRMQFADSIDNAGTAVRENLIAAYHRLSGTGMSAVYERIADSAAYDDADLFAYYEVDEHYVDLLNPDVTRAFIESTHEVYKKRLGQHFGKTIKGCFADEPQLNNSGYTWSFELPAYYQDKTGRNLLDDLWMLRNAGTVYDSIRHGYWRAVNGLFKQSFTEIISRWCSDNGIAFTGHFAAEDGLCDQVSSNGGVMTMYSPMQLPGIDHLGRRLASPVLMKQISSVAEQYGKDRVLSETFGCSGWNTSFEDMAWIWGHQAALGINLPCLHLSAYTIKGVRKRDYPVFFSHQEPWWEKFRLLNDYFAILNTLMACGRSDAETLVIVPMSGMWMKVLRPSYTEDEKNISAQYRILVENLLYNQISFDLGDESLIEKDASVKKGVLTLGSSAYTRIIVSQTPTLTSGAAAICSEFVSEGGELIFINSIPGHIDAMLCDTFHTGVFNRCLVIQNRKDMLRKYADFTGFKRSIVFRDENSDKISGDILVRVRNYDDRRIVFIWNSNTDSQKQLRASADGRSAPRLLDFREETDLEGRALPCRYNGEQTFFDVTVPARGSIVLSLTEEITDSANPITISRLLSKTAVSILSADRTDLNAMTVDRASYSMDGSAFSETMPVIHLQDTIYKVVSGRQGASRVTVRYRFDARFIDEKACPELFVVAETADFDDIRINGRSLYGKESGCWMDEALVIYPAGAYHSSGENWIEMDCTIPEWKPVADVEEVFETERNRFHYPIGIEPVYLRGDFNVSASGTVFENDNHLRIKDAAFSLTDAGPVSDFSSLTKEGLWFYRGNVAAETSFEIRETGAGIRYSAELDNTGFVLTEIHLNGSLVKSLITPPYDFDITDYVRPGINRMTILHYGSNRNLFGPHHHRKGETEFVGPSTFIGKRGYEDFVSPEITEERTWTDDYSFVKAGIGSHIYLMKYSVRTP